jgi:hypothetical protein
MFYGAYYICLFVCILALGQDNANNDRYVKFIVAML